MPPSPTPRRPRLKFLLASALAAASILLPLGPMWRQTTAEIEALRSERALLDPLTQALTLQRALLGHREVAGLVLRGRTALEAERLLRQGEVDAAIWDLQGTLSVGLWARALGETYSIGHDWRALAQRLRQRQIDLPQSQHRHQLLLEQAVQVMDLVSADAAPLGTRQALATTVQQADLQQAAWQAHGLALQVREAELRAARAGSLALAAAAWLALLILARALRDSDARRPDDTRRGHGRRATDAQPAHEAEAWRALLQPDAGEARSLAQRHVAPDTE